MAAVEAKAGDLSPIRLVHGEMSALRALLLVACCLCLGIGCGGTDESSGTVSRPGGTIKGCGLELRLPAGWQGVIYQLSPKDAITLQAATVGLPPPGGAEDVIARQMHAGDAYIAIQDIGPPPPGLGDDPAWDVRPSLPLGVSSTVVGGPYVGGFESGASVNAVLADRAISIRIRFGASPHPGDLDQLNRLLASLSVSRSRGACSIDLT